MTLLDSHMMRHRSGRLRPRPRRSLALIIASTLATSACAGDKAGPAPGEPVNALPTQPPAAPSPSSAAAIPSETIDRLRREAARHAGVPLDSVSVLGTEAVVWPDGGFGCSGPEESTLQVLTPGYRVVFAVGERQIEYRGDRRGHFSLCPLGRGGPPAEPAGGAVDR